MGVRSSYVGGKLYTRHNVAWTLLNYINVMKLGLGIWRPDMAAIHNFLSDPTLVKLEHNSNQVISEPVQGIDYLSRVGTYI